MRGHKNGARFKKLVQIGEPGECWEWLGNINKKTGYGKKQWFGETWLAHRWVWTMLFGRIKTNMTINHKCGNRGCVNPHHLEVVSQAENCRHGSGCILDEEKVREIRAASLENWGDKKLLAEKYGVSQQTIYDIRQTRS